MLEALSHSAFASAQTHRERAASGAEPATHGVQAASPAEEKVAPPHAPQTVLEVDEHACATNSPAPHCAHMEQARSSVAVQGPDAKVPATEQLVEQGGHVSAAPLVPRDVVPAAVQPHELPSAAHEAPAAVQEQVVEPFTALMLPGEQAEHA